MQPKHERARARKWSIRLQGKPGLPRGRMDATAMEKRLWMLLHEVLPSDERETAPGRIRPSDSSHLPQTPQNATTAGTAFAEDVWSYAQSVLLTCPRHVQLGVHQVVRVLLQAITDTLYPNHVKTHRSHIGLQLTQAALLNVNSILYTILAPQSLRARGVLNLLPPREANPLRLGQRGAPWRGAIRNIFRRQRNALLGWTGWEQESSVASV